MRALAASLILSLATQAVAEPTPTSSRSWLSAVGLGLVVSGGALAGFGLGQQLSASSTRAVVGAYGVPTVSEAPAVALLQRRADGSSTLALVGFIGAGALIAGGIVALLLDTPARTVSAFVIPTPTGGAVGLTAAF